MLLKAQKSTIVDAVTGDAIDFPEIVPVTLDDDATETIVIASGQATGVLATYDTSGYESVILQIDAGSNIDLRCRFNETGSGSPPSGRMQNLSAEKAVPISSTSGANSTGKWVIPVTGKKMQLYVNAVPSAEITLYLTRSRRNAPEPRGGRSSVFITTGSKGNLRNSASTVVGYDLINTSAATKYLQIYSTSSTPTVGSTTIQHTIPLPAGQRAARDVPLGWYLGSGIGWAITTDAAGATEGSSGDITGSVEWL